MTRRLAVRRWLLLAAAGLSVSALVGLTVYYEVTASSVNDVIAGFWWDGWLGFAVVGGLLVARRPDEPIGRLLTLIGFFVVVTIAGAGYANHDFGADHRAGVVGTAAALAFYPAFAAAFACTGALVLTFPTGRLDSRLRRYGAVSIRVALALTTIGYLVRPRLQLGEGKWIDNPLHPSLIGPTPSGLVVVGIVGLVLSAVVSLASAVQTFRRSAGDERQQMRWFARSATVLPGMFVVAMVMAWLGVGGSDWVVFAGLVVGLNAIAVAIGLAVARYRLYDIDRVVSRTASYAVVTGLVVGGYVGLVALIESVLGFSSSVAVAASTLTAAAAFQPLRRRVQRAIDRRFDRAAYDAGRTVEAFASRLRDLVDVDAVRTDLLQTASASVSPTSTSLWLVDR